MRALVLDFDGVVTPRALAEAHPVTDGMDWRDLAALMPRRLDPACVARVQRVCDEAAAVVVLSTSWRVLGLDVLRPILAAAGLTATVRGKIGRERDMHADRARAIREWVGYHRDVTAWVAVDDRADVLAGLGPARCVLTNAETGITDNDAARAVALLTEGR